MPALGVVLADRREDIQHERAFGPAVRRVLDASRQDVRLELAELVGNAGDDQRLHPFEDDPQLLVGMAVERDRCARLEADEVQHCLASEEGLTRDAGRELEGANCVETNELRLHALDYRCWMVLVELELLRGHAFVDGAWADADSGETFPVLNPATGDVWAIGGVGGAR